jgi:hypothetical protein
MYIRYHNVTKSDGHHKNSYAHSEEWYKDGYLHRVDGPARIVNYSNKAEPECSPFNTLGQHRYREEWYYEGYPHRIGGPALFRYGNRYWVVHGKMHREDGPAIMEKNKSCYNKWYINDIDITVEVKQWLKENGFRYPLNASGKVLFKLRFC